MRKLRLRKISDLSKVTKLELAEQECYACLYNPKIMFYLPTLTYS